MAKLNSYFKEYRCTLIMSLINNNNSKWKILLENTIDRDELLDKGSNQLLWNH